MTFLTLWLYSPLFIVTAIGNREIPDQTVFTIFFWKVKVSIIFRIQEAAQNWDQSKAVDAFDVLHSTAATHIFPALLNPLSIQIYRAASSRMLVQIESSMSTEETEILTRSRQYIGVQFAADYAVDASDATQAMQRCIDRVRQRPSGTLPLLRPVNYSVGEAVFQIVVGGQQGTIIPSIQECQEYIDALSDYVRDRRNGRWTGFSMMRVLMGSPGAYLHMSLGIVRLGNADVQDGNVQGGRQWNVTAIS